MTAEISKHPKRDEWTIKYFRGDYLVTLEYALTERDAYRVAREFLAVNK